MRNCSSLEELTINNMKTSALKTLPDPFLYFFFLTVRQTAVLTVCSDHSGIICKQKTILPEHDGSSKLYNILFFVAKNAKIFSPYCDSLRLKIHLSGNGSLHWMVRATGNQQRHLAASLPSLLLFHVSNRQLAETPSDQFAKPAAIHVSNRQLAETPSGQFAKPAAVSCFKPANSRDT